MPELNKLAAYYMDCIARDRDDGVSVYASNKYGQPDYGQISEWPKQDNSHIFAAPAVKNILHKMKSGRFSCQLILGYPLLVRQVTSKKGNTFAVVEPLLYQTYELGQNTYDKPAESQDTVRINPEAVKHLAQLNPRELTYEIMAINADLGLDGSIAQQPDLGAAAKLLPKVRESWPWLERLDTSNLRQEQIAALSQDSPPGVYNAAAFFVIEKSKFTQGLELELDQLRKSPANLPESILGLMTGNEVSAKPIPETTLIEPLPLNDEQRYAVRSALSAPLTVITGPPGTGKSQVVSSIVVNAAYLGEKVLFASKNNKAVDVVMERVNALSQRKIMIRLGRDSDGQELRGQLVSYMNGLLSASGTAGDKQTLDSCQTRHQELLMTLQNVQKSEQSIIKLRNTVDQLERQVEDLRAQLGQDKFSEFCHWPDEKFTEIKRRIDDYSAAIHAARAELQPLFTKLFWLWLKKNRLQKAAEMLEALKPHAALLGITPEIRFDSQLTNSVLEFAANVGERLDETHKARQYYTALQQLQAQPSFYELAGIAKQAQDEMIENSLVLWDAWLRLLPNRLTQNERRCLSEFATILQHLIDMGEDKGKAGKSLWASYYTLLPKVSAILPAWAVTSLSARNRVPFEAGFFDLVVIDEASQCDIASALPLLYRARRAVIIGDVKQLTHISSLTVQENQLLLERYGLEEQGLIWDYKQKSLFELAQGHVSPQHLVDLRDHHRSHADIINFSNQHFYSGNLRITTKYEQLRSLKDEPAVRWVSVSGRTQTPRSGGSSNEAEADTVVREIRRIVDAGYKGTIGAVSPFRAQVNLIRDKIAADGSLESRLLLHDFMVETVHRFQGDERDVILFSPVVAAGIGRGSAHFLQKTGNLFNVSLTRAKAALIIVGDMDYCRNGEMSPYYLRDFVDYYKQLEAKRLAAKQLKSETELGPQYPPVSPGLKVSEWEKTLYKALYQNGIHTLPQYTVLQYTLDLAIIDGQRKLDIEVDGERYHRDWNGELCRRDQLRNQRLIESGWDVMRFWVYEIRDDLPSCIERVKKWQANAGILSDKESPGW